MMDPRPLHVLLATPRGFCAGVVRAVDIVDQALSLYGAPVYVRHEIVHFDATARRLWIHRGRRDLLVRDPDLMRGPRLSAGPPQGSYSCPWNR